MKFKLNTYINFFVFFTIFLLLLNTVQAINLSTLQKNKYSRVKRGETAEFTILFWNVEDSSFPIKLKVSQAPENMIVIIRPKEFMLNSSEDIESSDIEYINTQHGILKAIRVRILVKASETIEQGKYDIIVSATAGEPKSGISTLLEKKFRFTVEVIPYFIEETTTTETTIEKPVSEEGPLERITGMVSAASADPRILFLIVLAVVILVIFTIIYKIWIKKSSLYS